MGLRIKVSLFGGLGLLFLVSILVFMGFWAVSQVTDRSLKERVAIARLVARGVDQALLEAQNGLERLAVMVDLEDEDSLPDQYLLNNLYTFSGNFIHIFLVNVEGELISSQPRLALEETQAIITSDVGISRTLRTASISIGSIAMKPLYPELMFSISVPIHGKSAEIVGAVTGHIELSRVISSFTQPLGLGSTAFMEVVNTDGMVMATSQRQVEAIPEETEYAAHFVSLIDKGEATMETCFRCHETEKGITRTKDILAFAPLSTVPGGVAIRQTEEEALAPSRTLLRYVLLAGIPLFVLGVVFTWISTRIVVGPVIQLTAASRRIAEGNLDVPIKLTRKDELGLLAKTFDRMRLNLKESLAQKEERAAEINDWAKRLAVLNAIATTVGRSLDLEQILQDSLAQVLRLMSIESGCIYLRESHESQYQLKASRNLTEELQALVFQLDNGTEDTMEVVCYNKAAAGKSITFVRVPLTSKSQILGLMWLASSEHHQYNSEEIEMLTSIGHQVGVAIDNARLFQETGRRESEAQALRRLGIEMSRLLDLERILTTVVDSARNLLDAKGTIVALSDAITGEVYVQSISGSLTSEFKNLRLKPYEDSLIGQVLNLGSFRSTLDYLNDPDTRHHIQLDGLFRENGIKSCLVVPLKIGESVSGVLMALYKDKSGFSDQEIELLQQLANQAAVAMDNTRLHNQVQELAIVEERARLSREMHDSLGQVLGYVGLKSDEIRLLLASGETDQAVLMLGEVKQAVRDASDEVRHAIMDLRTTTQPESELPIMLKEYMETYQQQTGLQVSLNVQNERATRFSTREALQLVRVIQEALSNVRKHARASHVEVKFEMDGDTAIITIADDGIGFEPAHVYANGKNFGIQVMKERVAGLGGSLEIVSHPGKGTRVVVNMSLEDRDVK